MEKVPEIIRALGIHHTDPEEDEDPIDAIEVAKMLGRAFPRNTVSPDVLRRERLKSFAIRRSQGDGGSRLAVYAVRYKFFNFRWASIIELHFRLSCQVYLVSTPVPVRADFITIGGSMSSGSVAFGSLGTSSGPVPWSRAFHLRGTLRMPIG